MVGAIVGLTQLIGHTDPPVLGPDVVLNGGISDTYPQDSPAFPSPSDDGATPVPPPSPPQAGDDDDDDDDYDYDYDYDDDDADYGEP